MSGSELVPARRNANHGAHCDNDILAENATDRHDPDAVSHDDRGPLQPRRDPRSPRDTLLGVASDTEAGAIERHAGVIRRPVLHERRGHRGRGWSEYCTSSSQPHDDWLRTAEATLLALACRQASWRDLRRPGVMPTGQRITPGLSPDDSRPRR